MGERDRRKCSWLEKQTWRGEGSKEWAVVGGLLTTWSLSDIQIWSAVKSQGQCWQTWCCYHRRPWGWTGSEPLPGTMLIPKGHFVAGELSVPMTYAATQGHGSIKPWNAGEDPGPTRVCVDVLPRSHRRPCFGTPPAAMLGTKGCDPAITMLIWVACTATRGYGVDLALSTRICIDINDACYTEGCADTWSMVWHLKPKWNSRVQSNYRLSPPSKYRAILHSQNLDIQILYVFKFRAKILATHLDLGDMCCQVYYVHSNA